MAKIDSLCHQLGIRIIPCARRRRPRETHARQVLTKLVASEGVGHVVFVLKAIVSTTGNAGELWSETVLAMSDVVTARPDLAGSGLAFFDALDRIQLSELRAQAQATRIGTTRQAMAVLLVRRLEDALTSSSIAAAQAA